MLLAIDIGNTNITLGVFDGDTIVQSWRLATSNSRTEDEYGVFLKNILKEYNLDKTVKFAVISSVVVQLTELMRIAVKQYIGVDSLIVSHKLKTNVLLKTDIPSQIGADRIANACAVAELYSVPAIVVDFGTATSFDVVNEKKEFIGGIITAGMKIQAEVLSAKTSKLPKLNIEAPKNAIGRNTIDAMLSGIVRGHALMVNGLILECEKELGEKAVIVATGGYSSVISNYMNRKFDYINPDLTLIGLNILYKLNK